MRNTKTARSMYPKLPARLPRHSAAGLSDDHLHYATGWYAQRAATAQRNDVWERAYRSLRNVLEVREERGIPSAVSVDALAMRGGDYAAEMSR